MAQASSEMSRHRANITLGVISGLLAWLLLRALLEEELGGLLTPAAILLGGLAGAFWSSRSQQDAESAPEGDGERNDSVYAWAFGSIVAGVVLHTLAQAGGL